MPAGVMHVLSVGLPDRVVTRSLAGVDVEVRHSAEDQADALVDASATLVVLAAAASGVSLAQAVHLIAPDVPVLFLAGDTIECAELSATLAITPGIDRHTRCLTIDDGDTTTQVHAEIERSCRRLEHHQTMDMVRSELRQLTSAPPERVSRYLGQLFDHAPIGILLAGHDGTVEAANPEVTRLLGWQRRHVVGADFSGMFRGQNADLARDLLQECTITADAAVQTLVRTGPTGSIQHLEVTVAPVDPGSTDAGTIILLRDESARMHAVEVADQARREAEDAADRYAKLAWTLQESLLPAELPDIAGVDIASRYHPSGDGSEIGGDFYDLFPVGDDEWFAVIGDVCGKGVGAARLTALSRYTLRAAALWSASVDRNLEDLNAALLRQYDEDRVRGEHRFATAAVARLRRQDGGIVIRTGSGGHMPPLVVRGDGRVDELRCRGPLLGMFDDVRFVTADERLEPGDALVLYTDGVTEARRADEQFGEDRLRGLLGTMAGTSADDIAGAIQDAVLSFQDGVARDDTAVLVIGAR